MIILFVIGKVIGARLPGDMSKLTGFWYKSPDDECWDATKLINKNYPDNYVDRLPKN